MLASYGPAVTVVDPAPGHGSTWAAAGMLAPVGEAHFGEEQLARLTVAAARAWPAFAAALEAASGLEVGYLASGTLLVAADPSDRAAVDRELAFRHSLDLAAERLGGGACREAEPLLSPGVSGGADLPEDHQVDNRRAAEALLAACRSAGVSFVTEQVRSVGLTSGRVTGIELSSRGRLPCDALVVAAGSRSGTIGGLPEEVRPPVRPVRGATLRLRVAGPCAAAPSHAARSRPRACLLPRPEGRRDGGRRRDGRGARVRPLVAGRRHRRTCWRTPGTWCPPSTSTRSSRRPSGFGPGSPDNGPIVGPTAVEGLLLATGHYRNGILLAPVTADEVARLLVAPPEHPAGGWSTPPGTFEAFRPDRFRPPPGVPSPPGPLAADPQVGATDPAAGAVVLHPTQ